MKVITSNFVNGSIYVVPTNLFGYNLLGEAFLTTGFIAAGAVQKGIKSRAIYLEDITKTFKVTLKDALETSQSLRV